MTREDWKEDNCEEARCCLCGLGAKTEIFYVAEWKKFYCEEHLDQEIESFWEGE